MKKQLLEKIRTGAITLSDPSKWIHEGDRVRILQSKHLSGLKHRPNHPVIGRVIRRNGGYIYVKPNWCHWEIELYDCELEKIQKG